MYRGGWLGNTHREVTKMKKNSLEQRQLMKIGEVSPEKMSLEQK